MQPVSMREDEVELRLEASISGFADRVPLMSARNLVSRGQRNSLIGLLIVIVIGLVFDVRLTFIVIMAFFTLLYLIAVLYRTYLFTRSSRSNALETVTDEEALSVPDSELPFYTILLPIYNEASVIIKLIDSLGQMDYPASRLEVLLLVEEDDEETLDALRAADPPAQFKLVVIPPAEPRTKPKALNFGLTLARGDIVAVYDAEDSPDILQLRRAAVALGRYGPEVACVQGQLSYRNATQNIITRWFTVEYAMWFSFFLPGLVTLDAPLPLGGTSNHFRRSALECSGHGTPTTSPRTATSGSGCSASIIRSRCSNRPRWRRPTAISSTGSSNAPAGTRATCRRSSSTSVLPVNSSARSVSRVSATCARSWVARRFWPWSIRSSGL